MPSAASSGPGRARGLSRPDTAPGPGRRAVRFADELGLGGEDGGRPATAPNERTPLTRGRRAGESLGGSFLDESPRDPGARSEESSQAKGLLLFAPLYFFIQLASQPASQPYPLIHNSTPSIDPCTQP